MTAGIEESEGWRCVLKPGKIEVAFQRQLKGFYHLLKPPYCEKCSYPGVNQSTCKWCWDDTINRTYAMGVYLSTKREGSAGDLLSNHIRGIKRYRRYSVPLGLGMALCIKHIYPTLTKAELLVPIPKHPSEFKVDAGSGDSYNQAFELARVISALTGIRLTEVLVKNRAQSMRNLRWAQRKEGVKDIYHLDEEYDVKGLSILLIDDVRTSGSTGSECARVLYEGGASQVDLLVGSRDSLKPKTEE